MTSTEIIQLLTSILSPAIVGAILAIQIKSQQDKISQMATIVQASKTSFDMYKDAATKEIEMLRREIEYLRGLGEEQNSKLVNGLHRLAEKTDGRIKDSYHIYEDMMNEIPRKVKDVILELKKEGKI